MVDTIRFYDACKQVVDKGSYALVRNVEGGVDISWAHLDMPERDHEYRAPKRKPRRQGWTILDHFTASAFVQVFEALNPKNQEMMSGFTFTKQIAVMWKLVKY